MDLMPKLPFEEWATWIYRAICIAVFLTVCGLCWNYGRLEVRKAADKEMADHLAADRIGEQKRAAQIRADQEAAAKQYQSEAEANARETFRRAEQQAQIERDKDERLASLARRADALARELRSRPERPTGDAAPGATGTGSIDSAAASACTGASLYRSDAQFLVGEAARADRILAERDACFDKYEALTKKRE